MKTDRHDPTNRRAERQGLSNRQEATPPAIDVAEPKETRRRKQERR